ncbi:hypothetical protein VN97_g1724 [Penicillium thymicola]|uniref:Uncharacterized protein n=1 Tax=Penicillium thymicola TaxID=293382 RepID=A0AAI9XC10_PENTH|nr:hypothetical protein VN97_g1724 [Penicillium thymicola]
MKKKKKKNEEKKNKGYNTTIAHITQFGEFNCFPQSISISISPSIRYSVGTVEFEISFNSTHLQFDSRTLI